MARGILDEVGGTGRQAIDGLSQLVARMAGGDMRIGVTGLRRAGKTVFITSLLHNLLNSGRLPFLDAVAQGRFVAARLSPQPDGAVPRFDYERHLGELTADPPRWPEPTRAISQIRVALRYRPGGLVRRRLGGIATLNLDIVDYPGEWLLDLPMLDMDFTAWSRAALELAVLPSRRELALPWLTFLEGLDPVAPADESVARQGAELYTAYLLACRASKAGLSLIQPGRFVEPGEMQGAPILTFFPLPAVERDRPRSLHALMAERFEGYKEVVIRRFYREHFSRLDRQIVLVDVLSALNAGAPGLDDLERSLSATLESFRHGRPGWLSWLGGARIDRVLFAATKADHVAASQHGNLKSLLESFLGEAMGAARFTGADVESLALASVKCTETVLTDYQGKPLACVQGTPVGSDQARVIFPGDLPAHRHEVGPTGEGRFNFVNFRPPPSLGRDRRGLPNIRMDRALQFLIGDRLS